MTKKVFSLIVALVMLLAITPISASAVDVTEIDLSGGDINITADGTYRIIQTNSNPTSNTITVEAKTANITIKDINIKAADGSAFSISPTSTVELTISGTNTLTGGFGYAGLWVPTGATATIQSTDGKDTDSLTANGGFLAAGIGGSYEENLGIVVSTCGTVNIKSGTINAFGGDGGAGIGGGNSGDGGTITISAEKNCTTIVTASCVEYSGAGIGGGNAGNGGTIIITAEEGGTTTVTATGSLGGAGIGGGSRGIYSGNGGDGGDITISAKTGGSTTVTATGGESGAGIGGGSGVTERESKYDGGNGGDIKILAEEGGSTTVTATGGTGGAGVGGGVNGNGGNIALSAITSGSTEVTAQGGTLGAGIGGGFDGGGGGNIALSAETGGVSTVTATGGAGGAGIGGGGYSGSSGDITISAETYGSTTVTATGGLDATGIGGGDFNGDCDTIEITGSTVIAKSNNVGFGSSNETGSIDISDSTIIATGEDSAIKAAAVTFDYNVDYIWRTSSGGAFTDSTTPYIWDSEAFDTYLEIQIPVTGIELDEATLALNIGETDTLTVTFTPESASDKTIVWTSSNESVATVDENGQVVAIGVGEATITATSGDMTATCEITVTEPTPEETNGITGFLRMIKMILELIIYVFGLFAG